MGKDLYRRASVVRDTFEEASEILDLDLAALCFEGPEEELQKTVNQQPAILTVSCALARLLQENGVVPEVAAGLSLGEYSALVTAGALAFADAVELVRRRGRYMQEAVPLGEGGMAALLGLDRQAVEQVCQAASSPAGKVAPANYNAPRQIVVSGHLPAVERAIELALAAGAKHAVKLPVSAPFHCSLMRPAAERLAVDLAEVQIHPARVPVVANVTASFVREPGEIRHYLLEQVSSPVLWEDSVRTMCEHGISHFIEAGPGRALCNFVRRIDRSATCGGVSDWESVESLLDSRKGVC